MAVSPDALYKSLVDDLRGYVFDPSIDKRGTSFVTYDNVDSYCQRIAASALMKSILKKYLPTDRGFAHQRKSLAIEKFLECNTRCSQYQPQRSALLSEMIHIANQELHDISWDSMMSHIRSGPGASVGSRGKNSFLEKFFINRWTTTSAALYHEYARFINQRYTWVQAEVRRMDLSGNVAAELVSGSKLSTVPKTSVIDRTICTEPSLNMAYQLMLGDEFNKLLRTHYGYDPALQPDRNRRMAYQGSRDGVLCTIDLSSASDTISLKLIEHVLRSDWVAAIHDCRSPFTEIDGSLHELHMVSSMGNGFTFPLQTYMFSLMIKAICKINRIPFHRFNFEKMGVFGDDIIVPKDLYQPVIDGLLELGFIPNPDKSFHAGMFRESCGADWFSGFDVRGVYCKSLETIQDHLSLINRLNRWSARHRIPLPGTIRLLRPRNWRTLLVPTDMSDTAGIHAPSSLKRSMFYTAYQPKVKLFRYIRKQHIVASHDNPLGIMLAASAGYLSSRGVSRRPTPTRYARVRGFAPFLARELDLKRHSISFADWEFYTHTNLTS